MLIARFGVHLFLSTILANKFKEPSKNMPSKSKTQPRAVDAILNAHFIACMDAKMQVLTEHALVIERGKIIAIAPQQEIAQRYCAAVHQCDLLIPGLINAHCHSPMSLLRGIGDDMPLMDWLQQRIWPVEQAVINAAFIQAGSQLAMAEMLLSGTTCFADMYHFPDIVGTIAEDIGIRAVVGLIAIDAPSAWAQNRSEYLSKGAQVYDQFKHSPLVSTILAPHAPYTTSDETLIQLRALGDELGIGMHMHIHETQAEVDAALENSGQRPLARLKKLGLLNPELMAVHMCALTDEEINWLATHNCHVVHCPQSNMKLASGICPVATLVARGINVALGTDGAASNNDLNMFAEMQTAALLAKVASQNPQALPAMEVLKMATINGARALGLDHITGSLEVGKAADIVAVDLNSIHCQPVYDPIAQLIYSAGRDDVSDVWVAGKQLVKARQLCHLNARQLIKTAQYWRDTIRAL